MPIPRGAVFQTQFGLQTGALGLARCRATTWGGPKQGTLLLFEAFDPIDMARQTGHAGGTYSGYPINTFGYRLVISGRCAH
jgi:hypothetical protein